MTAMNSKHITSTPVTPVPSPPPPPGYPQGVPLPWTTDASPSGIVYLNRFVHGRGTPGGGDGAWFGMTRFGMIRFGMIRLGMVQAITALILLCLFFIPFSTAQAASIANTGRISGQLLNGTGKNAPVAGQAVTLQMAQGNTSKDLTTVTTDAHGAYTFSNLATDSSINYALYTKYQGAQYTSDVVTLNSKPVQTLNLTEYEATSSPADIAIVQSTVLLHEPDAQKGIVSVSELLIFRNVSARTYVGSLDTSHGKPNALLFTLPHTAHNVSLGKGFDGYTAVQVSGGFASDAAVPPGDSQFAFAFDMPYTTTSYDFDYTVQYPTVQLTMLIPPDIHGSSSTLTAQGPVNANQQVLDLFQATTLTANQVIHLQLDGLPQPALPSTSSNSTNGPDMTWLIIGIGVMIAILLATWLFYRSKRRVSVRAKAPRRGNGVTSPARPLDAKKPRRGDGLTSPARATSTKAPFPDKDGELDNGNKKEVTSPENRTRTQPKVSHGKKTTAPTPAKTKEQKGRTSQKASDRTDTSVTTDTSDTTVTKASEQELLQELLELDKAYEAGTLTKAVYQERRASTKAQLRTLMSEKVIP